MPGAADPDTLVNLHSGGRIVAATFFRTAGVLALLPGLGHHAEPIPVAAIAAILVSPAAIRAERPTTASGDALHMRARQPA